MARLVGPLMSIDASGSIAGSLTFSKWKGRNYVRRLVIPANPRSALQVSVRSMMQFLSGAWASLTAAQKASWATLALAGNFSNINAYARDNQKRWTQDDGPRIDPASTDGVVPVMGALTATGGVGIISLSQVITTVNDIWGTIFTASTSTGYSPGRANTRLIRYGVTSPVTGTMLNVTAGTWYVRAAGIAEDGTLSAFIAEVTATVT